MTEHDANASHSSGAHEVMFVAYPKLLFIWPIIVAGLLFWFVGYPEKPAADRPTEAPVPAATTDAEGEAVATTQPAEAGWTRLQVLGWIYIWAFVLVVLTLGVDVDRNRAVFWIVLFAAIYILGLWLHDAKGIPLFSDIYAAFFSLDVRYDRGFGLALSVILLFPFAIMIAWAYLNDRWRITHNEFEHYSFGKMNDSLGRGAKTIRCEFPDVFELLLGLAGTLIVYNATGTKELRRIPHVMFLPFVRKRLDKILETTSITAAQYADEEDDEESA